jgi:threonine aldolase
VLAAISGVNDFTWPGYGEDELCARAADLIREMCRAPRADVQFLMGGTQANFTAICAFLRPWEGAVSPVSGHINGHDAGAVEATGHKIIPVKTAADGKLAPALIEPVLTEYAHAHMVKPRLVYISDATESGMVYTKAELTALSRFCRKNKLLLFLDGARLGCALSSEANDLTLPDLARLTDAFTIGGTKNGALFGEALVIRNPALQEEFSRAKKQRGAVLAKGWLLGVQFDALLRDDLYFTIARHADLMARRLQDGLSAMGWKLLVDSPTNQVFPIVSNELLPRLQALCRFETWSPYDESHTVIRFVTSFATKEEAVDGFLNELPGLNAR